MSTIPLSERPHMPAYGVDEPGWNGLPWAWAAERLSGTRNFWLTTVSGDGQPHSLPVWGVWDEASLQFSFSCAPNAVKARNVATNPRVTFSTTDTIECVSVQGTAERCIAAATITEWVPRYVAKYGDEVGDDFADFLGTNALFVVTPRVAFAVIERADEFSTRATRWRFATN